MKIIPLIMAPIMVLFMGCEFTVKHEHEVKPIKIDGDVNFDVKFRRKKNNVYESRNRVTISDPSDMATRPGQ